MDALRVRLHDDELQTDVSRVVGYAGRCPCGWRGRSRLNVQVARADVHYHKVTAHGHKPT